MPGTIVQVSEFVQRSWFKIRATLGCSFIRKHIVIVYTSSLHDNASKMARHSCSTYGMVVED